MTTLLYESMIAGLQFHDFKKIEPPPATGEELRLIPEPENPYDANAIRVELWRELDDPTDDNMHPTKWMLGYIPKIRTHEVHPLLLNPVPGRQILLTYSDYPKLIALVGIYGEGIEEPQEVPSIPNAGVEIDL